MIKSFKIFEDHNNRYRILRELSDQLDEDFVDEFFEENFAKDAKEIIELWPNVIWQHIDDDEYISDLIDDEKNRGIDDFSDDDYRKYIDNNITDKKEKKVLQLFNKKIKNKEDKVDEYDSDMLEDLTEKQLRKIIEDENEEDEFVEYIVTDRYEGMSAQEVFEDIYGGSNDNGKEVYQWFSRYIDEEAIEKDYLDEMDYDTKIEDIREEMYRSPVLQRKLIEIKKSNALLLADLYVEEKDDDNIYSEYDFQKCYVKSFVKKHKDESDAIAYALKFLNDNFGLDSDLVEKYPNDMWLVNSDKFNL